MTSQLLTERKQAAALTQPVANTQTGTPRTATGTGVPQATATETQTRIGGSGNHLFN